MTQVIKLGAVGIRPRPARKIVIFADGTGSSFASKESNVWRLYQALDKATVQGKETQLARYIPGVGTSSNAIIRALDGATGFGVPQNVRKLYRFLCWNWQPGDQIYLFGFSRGAFTVRTLAGLIAMQGLMPGDVTTAEMDRNTLAAWRAYRRETAPLIKDGKLMMNPLISVVRGVRDGLVWAKRKLLRQKTHSEVVAAQADERGAGKVAVRFMGLFDTVEAYGLPVEEMLDVVNWLIWPIRFRNRRCSWVVRAVRHALSLDEDRRSFAPLRFQQGPRPDGKREPQTQERWFAGVHADVGGGFPNDEIAFEPLLWIAGEAEKHELKFNTADLQRYRQRLYPQALIHCSRKGLASLYRYGPRVIGKGEENGGLPVVHGSVIRKIREGADGYAPLTLPEDFHIHSEDYKGFQGQHGLMRDLNAAEQVQRLISTRRATNWVTILGVLALLLPPIATLFQGCRRLEEPGATVACLAGMPSALPEVMLAGWPYYLAVLAVLVAVHQVNAVLAGRIKDSSRKLWRDRPPVLQSARAGR
jgi:uncharacterized protein (DUF2235 family)